MHKLILIINDFAKIVIFNCAVCTNCVILHLFLHIFMYSTFIYFTFVTSGVGPRTVGAERGPTLCNIYLCISIIYLCISVSVC